MIEPLWSPVVANGGKRRLKTPCSQDGQQSMEAFMEPDLEHRLSTASKETGETAP
jgi:hypothetical protein